jgi:WD40 repeat protein/DNA-binding SARP family transcriptional activator
MDFLILGPLEVLDEGRAVAVAGSKQRALLAVLLLHGNETLSTARLIDELWGEAPPATATKAVHVHVSRLRKALAAGNGNGASELVLTHEQGYELRLDPERLDAARFERLLGKGRGELAAGRPHAAAEALEEALGLWRGPPLADFAYEHFAQPVIARLEEQRVEAFELSVEARLALGRHAEVVPQLEALIQEHPYHERLRWLLMLALYRCDRQADALQAYQDARRQLVEELGIEPGENLRELERDILAQDPGLSLPAAEPLELPPELATGTPLVDRDADVEWLRAQWQQARVGAGGLVAIAGARGMGKTRLAAELAAEVHRERGYVLYLAAATPPHAVAALLEQARAARWPTLVVLDDVDRAGEELRAVLGELVAGAAERPVLLLATAEDRFLVTRLGAAATRSLTPLGADGVRAVARLYAGARVDEDVPVELLLEASGGVPLRAHRVAGEWARAEAEGRLDAAAGRAASERTGLRAAEDQLAGNVVELQAVRRRTDHGDAHEVVACPFKGLAVFDVEDAGVFFGREQLVAEMVARLAGAPLMGIVGPSGSGKSSALRAGLLASLAAGVLPGSEDWPLALLRPGEHPPAALERATAGLPRPVRMIVAVDQFEETFTACRDEVERAEFVHALVSAARHPRRRALVLIAGRADFYGRCAAYPELARLLGASHVLVGAMRRAELRRAIDLPARAAGLQVEPALADALIADVEGEPGGLPLLSTSLLELWQHRDGRVLRLSSYEHAGRVHGAVARLAERAYGRLDPPRRELARRILLRLAGEGEGDAVVRRRVPLAELEADRDERVAEVLAVLAGERLITVGADSAEVAHEALLREWPRLRGWLEEDAEGRRLHMHLRDATGDWNAGGRDAGELFRGARLAAALDWSDAHPDELNATERAFLDESRTASERSHRRLRMGLAGVAALLVLAVIAGLVALDQRGNARDQAVAADAQRLGASALAEDDLDLGLLLARQGVALDDSVQTRSSLLAALLKSPAALGVLRGDGERMTTVVLSPDERTLAAGSADNQVFLFDTRTRRRIRTLEPTPIQSWITEMAFTPDGSRLAIGHNVETYGNKVAVLDVRNGHVVQRIDPPRDRLLSGIRYSDDGRTLDLIAAPWEGDEGPPELVRYDARTGRRLLGPVAVSERGTPSVTVTSDGRRMINVGTKETIVRDARTLRVLDRFPIGGDNYALSGDDRTVAIVRGASVRLLDLRTGAVRTAEGRHGPSINDVRISADGRTLVTTGEDGKVALWDVQSAAITGETLSGHGGPIDSAQITRDGRTLYTSSADGTVFMWDLAGSRRLGRPFTTGTGNPGRPHLALSSDGRLIAAGQEDGAISVVDARTLKPRRDPFPVVTTGQVLGIGFLPGSHRLVVGGPKGFIAIVDADHGEILRRLPGHRGSVYTPGISADGRLLATGSDDNTVRLWSLPDGRPLGAPLRFRQLVVDAQLSPNGRWLTVAVTDKHYDHGAAEVWDVRTRRRVRTLERPDKDMAGFSRFSPDGRLLVTGYRRGISQVWSTTTWKPVTGPLAADAGAIVQAAISPNGRTLATGSEEGAVRLWDIETEQAVGAALPGLPAIRVIPYFTADGKHLIASYDTGRAYHWDIRSESLAQHACQVAGRRLTRAEWTQFLPGRPYRPAC